MRTVVQNTVSRRPLFPLDSGPCRVEAIAFLEQLQRLLHVVRLFDEPLRVPLARVCPTRVRRGDALLDLRRQISGHHSRGCIRTPLVCPAAQRRLTHDSHTPSARTSSVAVQVPLRDGRVPRWVVGGRRYQIVPKRILGILTDQLKMTPKDWTQALRGALFGELTGRGHTSGKGERGI